MHQLSRSFDQNKRKTKTIKFTSTQNHYEVIRFTCLSSEDMLGERYHKNKTSGILFSPRSSFLSKFQIAKGYENLLSQKIS